MTVACQKCDQGASTVRKEGLFLASWRRPLSVDTVDTAQTRKSRVSLTKAEELSSAARRRIKDSRDGFYEAFQSVK